MDPFDVLGLHPAASDEEIRDAYLRRSKQLHPDRYADASEAERRLATRAMQELNAAYDVLRHRRPEERASFLGSQPGNDAHLRYTPRSPPPAPPPPAPPPQRRRRWIAITVAAMLVTSAVVLASGGSGGPPPSPTTDSTVDLTQLNGRCITREVTGELEDIVDCTRPHDARIIAVVDHGTPCPIYAHATMPGPTKDLCLDTHQ